MTDLGPDVLGAATQVLSASGVPNPRWEARLLAELARGDRARFAEYVKRRAGGEPYSRIRGRREFWSLDFALSPETLDPRPDSETLINAALALLPDRQSALRVIDFGTGTGALLLALLSEFPNATGIGLDIQPGAAATARRNAEALGFAARTEFIAGDWREAKLPPADVILSNPPYIPSEEIGRLSREVADFDPLPALDGGADGLDAYRSLAPVIAATLKAGGVALIELGFGQADRVATVFREAGLTPDGYRDDLAGIPRCIAIRQEIRGF